MNASALSNLSKSSHTSEFSEGFYCCVKLVLLFIVYVLICVHTVILLMSYKRFLRLELKFLYFL